MKYDTEANWKKNAPTFIPRAGEIIIYSPDTNYSTPRFKVGDGENYLITLPFSNDELIMKNGNLDYWLNNSDYIPKAGEIVIINADNADEVASIKIGDGKTSFENLPEFGGSNTGDSITAQKLVNESGTAYNVGDPNNLIYFSNGIPVASDVYVWKTVPANAEFTDTKYTTATTSKEGLMSAEDKTTLDNLKNKAVLNTQTASSSQFGIIKLGSNLTELNGVVSVPVATTTSAGVMSAADKNKLDNIEEGANKITVDDTLSTTSTNPIQNKVINSEITKLGTLITQENSTTLTSAKNYTDGKIGELLGQAPENLNSLEELAAAMENNPDVVSALRDAIGNKANSSDLTATSSKIDIHIANENNPHKVTAAQVGLGNVENKNVATIKNEILTKTNLEAVGVSFDIYNEFAGAAAGLVPTSAGEENKYLAANGEWKTISVPNINYPVTSVNGQTGEVQLTAADVGALSDNTIIPEAIIVDENLTSTGINPVQGKTIYTALAGKQPIGDYALKSDIPTIPVTSVNGKTGAVQLTIPTALSQLTQTASYRTVSDTEKSAWNSKGTGTITGVTAGNGLSGGGTSGSVTLNLATSGVTATSYGPNSNTSPSAGGTFKVPYLTVDSYGRITSASTKTITLPAAPTSVTTATYAQTALAWNGGKGAVNQPIYFDSDGKAQTCNTIPSYSTFTASSSGLVPAPGSSNTSKFLRGDGTWQAISIDTSSFVTTSSLNTTLGNYVTSSSLNTTLSSYAKTSSVPTINYGTSAPTSSTPGKAGDLYVVYS